MNLFIKFDCLEAKTFQRKGVQSLILSWNAICVGHDRLWLKILLLCNQLGGKSSRVTKVVFHVTIVNAEHVFRIIKLSLHK